MKNPKFDLERFSELNAKRAEISFGVWQESDLYFTTALAEEVGEVCGAVKKLTRPFTLRDFTKYRRKYVEELDQEIDIEVHESEHTLNQLKTIKAKLLGESPEAEEMVRKYQLAQLRKNLKDEVADVFIYLDLLCSRNSIDLFEAVKDKFNEVSDSLKSPFKITE